MTTERTNEDRAESAFRVLLVYSQQTHSGESYQDYHISDLLCDLHHFADEHGEDWGALLETATMHYDAETVADPDKGEETAGIQCRYCGRNITLDGDVGFRGWIDPEATGDDSIWRETCDKHDTFIADHEPVTEVTT